MSSKQGSGLLRGALRANAAFSGLSAIVLVGSSGAAASFLGAAEPVEMLSLGVQLGVFAVFLAWLSRRPAIPRWPVIVVIALDLLWVVSSAALLLSPPDPLTVGGRWAIGLVAGAVLVFADLQFFGLRRLRGPLVSSPAKS